MIHFNEFVLNHPWLLVLFIYGFPILWWFVARNICKNIEDHCRGKRRNR
jgi:hypothetical protein